MTTGFWQQTQPKWRSNKFSSQPLFPGVHCFPKCQDGHLLIQDILTRWQGVTFQKEMTNSAELCQSKTAEMGPLKARPWWHTCGHCKLAKSILSSLLLIRCFTHIKPWWPKRNNSSLEKATSRGQGGLAVPTGWETKMSQWNGVSTKWQLHPSRQSTGPGKTEREEQFPNFWLGQPGQHWSICRDGAYWFWKKEFILNMFEFTVPKRHSPGDIKEPQVPVPERKLRRLIWLWDRVKCWQRWDGT